MKRELMKEDLHIMQGSHPLTFKMAMRILHSNKIKARLKIKFLQALIYLCVYADLEYLNKVLFSDCEYAGGLIVWEPSNEGLIFWSKLNSI